MGCVLLCAGYLLSLFFADWLAIGDGETEVVVGAEGVIADVDEGWEVLLYMTLVG